MAELARSMVNRSKARAPAAPVRQGANPANRIAQLQRTAGNCATEAALVAHSAYPARDDGGGGGGGGQPLPDDLRAQMEARFGADFGAVRVHDHGGAHAQAEALGAKAFTHGEDIVFGAQRFAPHAEDGRRLLAHELAHVVQQRRGGPAPGDSAQSPTEQGADAAAQAVVGCSGPVAVSGASGVGIACDKDEEKKKKEEEEERRVGQASTTVLSQKQLRVEPKEKPIDVVNDPNKGRGTGAEVQVPFDRYAGPDWSHIGGGSETASSRTSLARRSATNDRLGMAEGTSGLDFLVEHVKTDRLVIGEQKATAGREFAGGTAITTSLEVNVQHAADTLRQQIKDGKVPQSEIPRLEKTIARLDATHKALLNPTNETRLPEGVVFEFTNVGGKGETIGNQHVKLLAEKYGDKPGFVEHLLGRTFVRDPALAAKKGRKGGTPGTDSDADIVPAMELLNDPAKDTLERLKAGQTEPEWKKQKAKEQADRKAAEKVQQVKEAEQKKQARKDKAAADKAARDAAKKQRAADAKRAGDEARDKHLADAKAKRAAAGQPEPTTVKARKAEQVDANKAGRAASKKHAEDQDKADLVRKAAEKSKQAADRAAQKLAETQQQAAKEQLAKQRAAEAKKLSEALAEIDSHNPKSPEEWGKLPRDVRKTVEDAAAKDPALAAKLNEKVNAKQTQDFNEHAKRNNADVEVRNRRRTTTSKDEKMSKAARGLNEAAGAVRGVDAFLNARDEGKGYGAALFEGGKTYFENTNQLLGAVATFESRTQMETLPDGTKQQYYGEDAGDAFFGTLGENIAGFIVPGSGADQLINGASNLIAAGDDHLKRGEPRGDPAKEEANLRTGTDLIAELTPSRMFASTIGAGLRAYYDLGKAAGGQTSGVDKFADDGLRGKLGAIIQPWAMAADFFGNLGGDSASVALDKTLKKTEGTTLSKIGNASGDAMYELGESKNAKSGMYGGMVASASTLLGITSDMIAGQDFNTAVNEAASEGSMDAKVIAGVRDTAVAAKDTAKEVWNEDLPAARQAAGEAIDKAADKVEEIIDDPGKALSSARSRLGSLLDF